MLILDHNQINCLKVLNDELKLVSGSEDKIIIWSIDTGACLKTAIMPIQAF